MQKLIILLLVIAVSGFFAARWLVQRLSPMPAQLGLANGRFLPCPDSPNCVSSFDTDEVHRIDPMTFSDSLPSAKVRLYNLVTGMPRTRVITNTPNYIHAEFRSAVWHFVDDVEFFFDEENGLVHMKSAARLGSGDAGVNRKRLEQIRAAFMP